MVLQSSSRCFMEWEADGWRSSAFSAYGELLRETEDAASFLASYIAHPLTLSVALTFYVAMVASRVYHSRYYCFSDVFKSFSKTDNGTVSITVQLSTTARAHPYPPEPFESRLNALSHLDGGFYWKNLQQRRSNIQGCCSLDVAKISAKDNESLFGIIEQGICARAINMHANEILWSGLSLLC